MLKKQYVLLVIGFLIISACLSGCIQSSDESDDQNTEKDEEEIDNKDKKEGSPYQWSQMTEGPYLDKVSYATSTNLLDWTDSQQILVEHASVPGALYKDGVIYVYFVDVSEDGKPEQIGLIRSEDNGQNWLPKEHVTFEGIGDKVPVDPALFLLDDGRIRLYYYDINEGRTSHTPSRLNKIYSAVSDDGLNFIDQEGVCFQAEAIFDPVVVCVDGVWRLYVGKYTNVESNIISAVSNDGLNFVEEGVAYAGGAVPDVFYKNGTYYLYTVGIDISISEDGANFTKTSSSFQSQSGMITADASVIQLDDGTYMMLYKTR